MSGDHNEAVAPHTGATESAQARWRAITGAQLVALLRWARFENDVLVAREEVTAA